MKKSAPTEEADQIFLLGQIVEKLDQIDKSLSSMDKRVDLALTQVEDIKNQHRYLVTAAAGLGAFVSLVGNKLADLVKW